MRREIMRLIRCITLFMVLAAGGLVGGMARAEVQLEFDAMAFNGGRAFSFPVPGDLKAVHYAFEGRGNSVMRVAACRTPQHLNDTANSLLTTDVMLGKSYPRQVISFARGQRPELQNCNWGAWIQCLDRAGCSGRVTLWWDTWSGVSSRGDSAGRSRPEPTEIRRLEPADPVLPPASEPSGTIAVGDAGTNNNDAALVGYGCRISGELRQGDYDNFVFFFPGGPFRAHSLGSLNLVADLLDAAGRQVARSGVDTTQFDINGTWPGGKYYLQVRVMHHAGAGPYQIQLGPDSGCRIADTP